MFHIHFRLADDNCRYGLGVAHQTLWIVPYIGAGCISFGMGALPTITMSYGNVIFVSSIDD